MPAWTGDTVTEPFSQGGDLVGESDLPRVVGWRDLEFRRLRTARLAGRHVAVATVERGLGLGERSTGAGVSATKVYEPPRDT